MVFPLVTNYWNLGAARVHATASISHTRPSSQPVSYSFPIPLRQQCTKSGPARRPHPIRDVQEIGEKTQRSVASGDRSLPCHVFEAAASKHNCVMKTFLTTVSGVNLKCICVNVAFGVQCDILLNCAI